MLQIYEFVLALRSSVWVVFNNFLLIDATDRSKISSDQKCYFFAVRLSPFHFANTPFNCLPENRFMVPCTTRLGSDVYNEFKIVPFLSPREKQTPFLFSAYLNLIIKINYIWLMFKKNEFMNKFFLTKKDQTNQINWIN